MNDDTHYKDKSKVTETKVEPGEVEQIDLPEGIVNYLQKENGITIPLNPPLRNSTG